MYPSIIAIVVLILLVAGVYFGFKKKSDLLNDAAKLGVKDAPDKSNYKP